MDAKVRGLWLLAECPHCNKPQVLFRYVLDNTVDSIMKKRFFNCEHCDENCFIELKEAEYSVQ